MITNQREVIHHQRSQMLRQLAHRQGLLLRDLGKNQKFLVCFIQRAHAIVELAARFLMKQRQQRQNQRQRPKAQPQLTANATVATLIAISASQGANAVKTNTSFVAETLKFSVSSFQVCIDNVDSCFESCDAVWPKVIRW